MKARYRYLADGTKLEVRDNNEINGFDYLGSLTYKKSSMGVQLESASFGEGEIRANVSNGVGNEVNYFLTDHLGSVRVIVDGNGVVKERNDYYSFGARHSRGDYPQQANNRYKYNGKEEQVTGDLDYLDYGARMYDRGLGKWFGCDPLSEKYYNISSYTYTFNNPINVIDPDGREGIVVSGSPGDHKNRDHFLINGLDRAKSARKRTGKGEGTTWIIYNDKDNGFKQESLDKYIAEAKKAGINVKVVSEASGIVDYINNKNGDNSRNDDKISSFYYVGHATPGDLDVGYQGSGQTFDPSDLKSNAFKSSAWINVVGGCRTAIDDTFLGITIEKSIIRQFSDILDSKSTIHGSNVRVFYPGGVVTDSKLLEKNKGKIVTIKGNRK